MSTATLNGELVGALAITVVRQGRWTASVSVPSGELPADGVMRLRVADTVEWVGRAVPGAAEVQLDTLVASVRGGLGDVAIPATPRHYRLTTVGTVLADLAADAGESLSPRIDPALLAQPLEMHTTLRRAVSVGLTSLLSRLQGDAVWRFEPSGELWVGVDAFPEHQGQGLEVIMRSPMEMAMRVQDVETLPQPGEAVDGRHIGTVEHRVDESGIISCIYFEELSASDDIKGALQRFIRATAPFDFAITYAAEVRSQSADGTFDVRLVDSKLSDHSRVKARWAYAGVVATVQPGTPCLLAFENGDPGRPVILGFDFAGLLELRVGSTTGRGDDVTNAALLGTPYRAKQKQLNADLAANLTEASVALAASATALGPTPGSPGAAGLTTAANALASAASKLVQFEVDGTAAGDWLSVFLRLK